MNRKKCQGTRLPSPRIAPNPSASLKMDKRKSYLVSGKVNDQLSRAVNLSCQMKKLSKAQLRAFREVFENFDLEKTGTLTAKELHLCINQLAGYQALSFENVMHILKDLDVKGTGDIEFDEFIFFMTRPQNLEKMLSDEDKMQIETETGVRIHEQTKAPVSKADRTPADILVNILQRVLEQGNNMEIRNFYRQQILNKMDDNVIHSWSDGKRCIGLSYREILKRYKEIAHQYMKDQSFKKYLDSPYAKPNKWGIDELKRDIEAHEKQSPTKPKTTKEKKVVRVKVRELEITVEAVPLPIYKVKKMGAKFTYDDVKQIRENVAKLKKRYYTYLQSVAAANEISFHEGLGINNIRNKRNRQAANYAFDTYCNPFVVSPWVPTPNPTNWRTSVSAPIGKALSQKGRYLKY